MRTVVSTIASQYPPSNPPSISFLSINAEELPDISEDYDVSAVPFVVVLRDGQILESVSGSDAVKVRAAVERHAGAGSGSGAQGGAGGAGSRANIPPPLSAAPREGENPPVAMATQAPEGAGGGQSQEALFARLAELVKAAPVMLFMKGSPSAPQCGFSRQLVGILRERSVKYGFFNILADEEVRQGLKEFAEWPTFPQLWVGGELVGGLDIVREEIDNDPGFLNDYSANKASAAAA
ncbi:Monothiol [Aspergillus sp. HF37]|nr:Monothiol [Aspergillus sp. HF37]